MSNRPLGIQRWIDRKLEERDWTGADLIRASNDRIKSGSLSKWRSGAQVPSSEMCQVLAEVLREDEDYVLTLAGHRSRFRRDDPDGTAAAMHSLIDAVDWERGRRAHLLRGIIDDWIQEDASAGCGSR